MDLSKVDKLIFSAAISACEKVEMSTRRSLLFILVVQRQLSTITFNGTITSCEKVERCTQRPLLFFVVDLSKVDKIIFSRWR